MRRKYQGPWVGLRELEMPTDPKGPVRAALDPGTHQKVLLMIPWHHDFSLIAAVTSTLCTFRATLAHRPQPRDQVFRYELGQWPGGHHDKQLPAQARGCE